MVSLVCITCIEVNGIYTAWGWYYVKKLAGGDEKLVSFFTRPNIFLKTECDSLTF